MNKDKKRYEILKNLHSAQGELAYHIELFGDTISEREGYKNLNGMEAVHFGGGLN
jgi:hypothetical protein